MWPNPPQSLWATGNKRLVPGLAAYFVIAVTHLGFY